MEDKTPKKKLQLTAARLARGLPAGKYYDGRNNGLDFQSYGNGRGCWGIRIMVDGKRHFFPGGGYPCVSLKKARRFADKIKRRLLKGKPGLPEKDPQPDVPTFAEASCAACNQRLHTMLHPLRGAVIGKTPRQTPHHIEPTIRRPKKHRTSIGRHAPAVELADDLTPSEVLKNERGGLTLCGHGIRSLVHGNALNHLPLPWMRIPCLPPW